MQINIAIGSKEVVAVLEDNVTAQEFAKLLPLEFAMEDLNDNEKYAYMEKSLPVDAERPDRIRVGDIMLYGDNCLVIFYKTFRTQYKYTRIGHINELPDLENGSVRVRIEKAN